MAPTATTTDTVNHDTVPVVSDTKGIVTAKVEALEQETSKPVEENAVKSIIQDAEQPVKDDTVEPIEHDTAEPVEQDAVKPIEQPQEPVKESESLVAEHFDVPKLLTDHREPLKLSGALDHIKFFDSTPVIGREFEDVNIVELLNAPNSDELLRDLAITSKKNGYHLGISPMLIVPHSLAKGRRLLPQAGRCDRTHSERARAASWRADRKAINLTPAHPSHHQCWTWRDQG